MSGPAGGMAIDMAETFRIKSGGVSMRRFHGAALAAALLIAPAAIAQDAALAPRVDRLEREMRAVQRKVFPGGAGQTLEPQITAPQARPDAPGTPAGDGLADVNARITALEASVANVTGQVEQATFRVRQLEQAFEAYKRTTDARLRALEESASRVAATTTGGAAATGDTAASDVRPTRPATAATTVTAAPAAKPPAAAPRPAATTPADPARAEAVAAIEKPATGDAAEDGYTYGFRLWNAKLYPEAIAALKPVAEKFPKHRRASFAQNLIGRAYLDDGKPSLASLAFYDSYKKWPEGERAPDSLFYLAKALEKLKKPAADICKVYGELTEVFGARISATMKADVARSRTAQKCP